MTVNRRQFMKRAGLTGGALAAATALPACHTVFPIGHDPGGTLLDGLAGDCPVDTVIVLMMENRSFAHWLGWLGHHEGYLEAGRAQYGEHFAITASHDAAYPDPAGVMQPTRHMVGWDLLSNPYRGCDLTDPRHGWTTGRAQRDLGFVAQGANNDPLTLGYYDAQDLDFTRHLVKRFTTFDSYHCSVLGPTYPNREYLHSAQSGGNKSNAFPTGPDGFEWPTIWDKLAAANVPAGYYYGDLPFLALFGSRTFPLLHPFADYLTDCQNGTLPNVVFLDPAFTGEGQNDDHPLADIRAGQAFAREAFRAFANSPQWERGVFIITYDEWGGFFDQVAPVHLPDDRASADDAEDFSQAGFRVPTIMASPFAHSGLVDRRIYDHTSILRFLEWRFLGAPPEGPGTDTDTWYLTRRDRYANNIGASLAPKLRDKQLWFDIDMPIAPPSAACGAEGGGLSVMARSVLEADDPAFDEVRWGEYFDRVGLRVS